MLNEEAVLEVNQRFYKAINDQDLGFMRKIWSEDFPPVCLHPGWKEALRGQDAILQSWEAIFSSPDPMEIQLANIDVSVSQDLAWVSCEERIFFITLNGVRRSNVYATNVFKLIKGSWKMVLHHASNLPDLSTEEELSTN